MRALTVLLLLLLSNAAFATTSYFNQQGVAILGYDVVAYHVDAKAMKGNKAIAYEWSGTTWLFSSKDNRKKFKQSPENMRRNMVVTVPILQAKDHWHR